MASLPEKPRGVSTYDFETGTYLYDPRQMDAAQIWRSAVACAATKARQALPECTTRIDKALELVLNNAVELLDDGTARVTSQQGGTTAYVVCNGTCECADFAKAPQHFCKHRLARALCLRAMEIAKTLGQASSPVTIAPAALPDDLEAGSDVPPALPPVAMVPATPALPEPTIPSQFLVTIQGKPFVSFHGLLDLATRQGLLSLTEEVTHVSDTYVLASARAEFHDGRVFCGIGDSSPDNVGKQVKPHWRRLAGTRAKARCLRDALNINLVAVEELD